MKKILLALILLASISPLWAQRGRGGLADLSDADFDMEKMKIGDSYFPAWNERSQSYKCHGLNTRVPGESVEGDARQAPLNLMCMDLKFQVLGRMAYANGTGVALSYSRISSMSNVILHSADLFMVRFQSDSGGPAYLMDVMMDSANLLGAVFAGASLSGVTLERADIEEADFSGANLRVVSFKRAILRDTSFEKANLGGGTTFKYAALIKVSFRGATMTDVDFKRAKLLNVDMRGVYFAGTDLSKVNLDKVDLRCSIYHSNIKRFPFSEEEARARGMISELEAFGDGQRGIKATRPVEKCLQEIGRQPKFGLNPR